MHFFGVQDIGFGARKWYSDFEMETAEFSAPLGRVSQGNDFVKSTLLPGFIVLALILGGVGTGWYLSGGKNNVASDIPGDAKDLAAPGAKVSSGGKEVGLSDEATFRDRAEGVLEAGGIDSEGTHHLVRTGGESQTVYLTSSVVDLDAFLGKKVEVWGETNKGHKAAWLMDAGRIKILE